MTKKLQHVFALSEKGAKDLVKAVIWCFVCNLSLMLPVGAVLFTAQHLLDAMETGGSPMEGFWIYTGSALAVLVLLFVLHWFQYASLYLATYKESASRRVSLAETLRRLPLSFFGNRDLSDLTSTMIADCSSLDQMFSHYVPQLFASVFSTLVIGVAMFVCDWRMALAIKACSRQDAYMEKLEKKLAAMEKGSIHSELATGVFVCSAQAFLRLGLATTILTGGALLAAGKLSFLYFLGFLFAAARLYDPLGLPPPGCTTRWGLCSRISPPPSTPNCRSSGCAPFWNSRCRRGQLNLHRRTMTSPLTMSPSPTGRGTAYLRM